MGKILFINGSPNENGCVSTAMDEVIEVLNNDGIDTEKMWLGKKAMPDCMACMKCQQTGECVFRDQVHGFTAEDVRKDEEGLQTMRTLGRNLSWLMRLIENGEKNDLSAPAHEIKTFTNFI